jgi:hypothetical protein
MHCNNFCKRQMLFNKSKTPYIKITSYHFDVGILPSIFIYVTCKSLNFKVILSIVAYLIIAFLPL